MPSISRSNVGTLTPDDLIFAVDLFEAKFGTGDD